MEKVSPGVRVPYYGDIVINLIIKAVQLGVPPIEASSSTYNHGAGVIFQVGPEATDKILAHAE